VKSYAGGRIVIEAGQAAQLGDRSGARRYAAAAYAGILAAFCVGTFVQIYLAGVGAFGGRHAFGPHETSGNVLGIVALAALVAALAARAGRSTVLWTLLLALLTEVAQHGLASGGHDSKWVGGLHALDGLAIVALGVFLLVRARRRLA
jgi:hypothetical protein